MWMTPFYLFFRSIFCLYFSSQKFTYKKLKYFFSIFLILFIFSPISLLFNFSITQKNKRTDYPGKKIAQKVQMGNGIMNFTNKIEIVVGYGWINEWYAGNLSYHLKSRPKWYGKLASYL